MTFEKGYDFLLNFMRPLVIPVVAAVPSFVCFVPGRSNSHGRHVRVNWGGLKAYSNCFNSAIDIICSYSVLIIFYEFNGCYVV
jgi:hypothetical protein